MLNEDPSAKVFVEAKIEQLENVTRTIENNEGEQATVNVLDNLNCIKL